VDREAKRAAEGFSSDKHLLPLYIRKPLPTNPAATKRVHHKALKALWKMWWKALKRGRRDTLLDKAMPLKKFLKMISQSELSCKDSSHIMQLRLVHALVNQYLNHIGRANSTRCPACGDKSETVEHFLLQCPNYVHE
jgi:hypothetical protein